MSDDYRFGIGWPEAFCGGKLFSASVRAPLYAQASRLALQTVRASAEREFGGPVFLDSVRVRTTEEWDQVKCVAVVVELTAIAHPLSGASSRH